MNGQLLTRAEVADRLNISVSKLEKWPPEKGGPPTRRIGGSVRYSGVDLDAWLRERSTSGAAQDEPSALELALSAQARALAEQSRATEAVEDLARQRATLVATLIAARDEIDGLAAAASRGEEPDVFARIEALTAKVDAATRHVAFFDEQVAPPANARLEAATAASEDARRRIAYEETVEKTAALRAELADRYPELRREFYDLKRRTIELQRAINAVNEALPEGAASLPWAEPPLRDAEQLPAELQGRVEVWLYVGEAGNIPKRNPRWCPPGYGPAGPGRTAAISAGAATYGPVPLTSKRFWEERWLAAVPYRAGARLEQLIIPPLRAGETLGDDDAGPRERQTEIRYSPCDE